jgi:Icc-related predicted phosphoesterase
MGNIAVFTSDLHGNDDQYQKLLRYASTQAIDTVILGGDLLPKNGPPNAYVQMQRDFLEHLIDELKEFKLKKPKTVVYLMPGNDDAASLQGDWDKYDGELYNNIHRKRFPLSGTPYDIIGYSFVPLTKYLLKDWEMPDVAGGFNESSLKGVRSEGLRLVSAVVNPKITIESDLDSKYMYFNSRKTIHVFHAPPVDTDLDVAKDGSHIGSKAIRDFIHSHTPYFSLHGHVHGTVARSGKFMTPVSDSCAIAAGNDDCSDKLAIITLDLYDPGLMRRKVF